MDKLENYTIDVLRALQSINTKNFLSVDWILENYFRYNSDMKRYSLQIYARIKKNQWGFFISEDDGIKINDSAEEYLESVTTDEYIINRCFVELQSKNDPEYLDNLLNPLYIKIDEDIKRDIQAEICASGLVKCNNAGLSKTILLTDSGRVALKHFTSYSEYKKKKHQDENRKTAPTIIMRDNYGNASVGDKNQLSSLNLNPINTPSTTPTKTETKHGKMYGIMKFILNHIIAITVAVIAGLIVAYLAFRFHWFG